MRILEITQTALEGIHDPHIFKAVFMAGGPGSGKSTIAKKLFTGTGLRVVNIDVFANLHRAKGSTTEPARLHDKNRIRQNLYTRGKLGLVIDGTGRNVARIQSIKQELESMGYETAMVFVNTDSQVAHDRVKARAQSPGPDQGRTVEPNFVDRAWQQAQQNIGKFQQMFSGRMIVVDNNDQPDLEYAEKSLRQWLNAPVNNAIARAWIAQHKSSGI